MENATRQTQQPHRLLRDKRMRSVVMSVNAALWYGAWAYYANRTHGWKEATQASLTQAVVSLTITFLVTMTIELVSQCYQSNVLAIALSAGSAIVLVGAYTVTFHTLLGTPEVLATIAPVFLMGSIYCISYAIGVRSLRQRIEQV